MSAGVSGLVEEAARVLGGRARRDVPIGPLTTYRVGGSAELWVEVASLDDLRAVSSAIETASHLPVLVLGRGSNLLVADAGFPGLVVTLDAETFATIEVLDGSDPCLVRAGGAVDLPVLARQTAAQSLTGLEWAVGVPGSVGGAVRMNAGGHGSDTSERLVSCESFDLRTGTLDQMAGADLRFGYRQSAVESHHVVVAATYRLDSGDHEQSEAAIREIVRWRREHQPGGQNAGSVFTNPPRDSAGRLIEAAGLKGYRVGSAMVSEKHANFIQADPGGSANDIVALMLEIQRVVAAHEGIELHAEVKLAGFDPASTSTLHSGSAA
ncbi:MAG TPA: UDP-N-acetylmuramate dehydrogenase [Acidimicrobiales bacterium]